MILEALELGIRDPKFHEATTLPSVELHVERVLPQSWQEHWPLPDRDTVAAATREAMLHNIGNLKG